MPYYQEYIDILGYVGNHFDALGGTLLGKNERKVKCACISIIQPPSKDAQDPVPLIQLKLDLMDKVSNHVDPLPSS